MPKGSGKVLSQNKKANHDYFIEETYETGIVLQGTEIKSIRAGRVNLKDSFAKSNGEKCFSTICTSAHMSRETAITTIRSGQESC